MPDFFCTGRSRHLNILLRGRLRTAAKDIRELRTEEEFQQVLDSTLRDIYHCLSICLGSPAAITPSVHGKTCHHSVISDEGISPSACVAVEDFFQETLTPRDFYQSLKLPALDDYVSLVHDPRACHSFMRKYQIPLLGNVLEQSLFSFVNVPIEVMKEVTTTSLLNKCVVWFGCDFRFMKDKTNGILDCAMNLQPFWQDTPLLDKADRLVYRQTKMTHAMLFTGVDIYNGRPRYWRVENSQGEKSGANGFYLMTENWFDEYVFQVVIHRKFLPSQVTDAAYQKKIESQLPPWDPLGALAI